MKKQNRREAASRRFCFLILIVQADYENGPA